MKKKGVFITFEGPEGSGKSTLIKAAARFFKSKGFPVLILREPGGTAISEAVREILLDRKNLKMTVETELFLYLAARAQIVREKILPALKRGKVVICDRYHDSTVAYQGYAGGIPVRLIDQPGKLSKAGLEPDFTFLLDVETEKGLKRAGRTDRMEKKSLAFHRRVRRGFLALARKHPARIFVLRDEKDIRVKVAKLEAALSRLSVRLIKCLG